MGPVESQAETCQLLFIPAEAQPSKPPDPRMPEHKMYLLVTSVANADREYNIVMYSVELILYVLDLSPPQTEIVTYVVARQARPNHNWVRRVISDLGCYNNDLCLARLPPLLSFVFRRRRNCCVCSAPSRRVWLQRRIGGDSPNICSDAPHKEQTR
jgi:hypothetical protein